jgi:opacity protein-like surface antigen
MKRRISMKKLLIALTVAAVPLFGASAAHAATVIQQVQAAVQSGNYEQIDVIAAKNPEDQGDIAMYLLQQSQNSALSEQVRIKLFTAAAPFGSQIPTEDATEAATLISNMLTLSGNPNFQKDHPKEAANIIATALSLSNQPNILASNEGVHNEALAQANDLPAGFQDAGLQDQVDLALQVGLSPPLGPRGIIAPFNNPLPPVGQPNNNVSPE